MKIYIESLKNNIKCALEFRKTFILSVISQFGVFFSYYFLLLALFQRFSNIRGFTIYEVLLCFGVIHFGFAFNETFFRGIDKFEDFISNGSLDRLLVRPQGILFQVLCSKMDVVKITRLFQALFFIVYSFIKLKLEFNYVNVVTMLMMMIASVVIFFSLFLLMAAYCFVTIEGLEIKNLMTDGGKHLAQYPMGIFRKGFLIFFTFVIPYASVNYYPLLYLVGKSNSFLHAISPIFVFLFLIPCYFAFNVGLKHYESAGS